MTTALIQLPEELKVKVERSAEVRGLSLDDFVRESLEARLRALELNWSQDPLFAFQGVYEGPAPPELSERHDDYLYGETD
jgi:hypothetical protein